MGFRAPGGGATALAVTLSPDGSVVLNTSYFEQGTGTYTTLRQSVAEELACDPDEIQVRILDTDSGVSFDNGIGGSRGTRVATGVAFQAAREAKEELFGLAEKLLDWPRDDITMEGREILRLKTKQRQRWDELLARVGRSITKQVVTRDNKHAPVTAFTAQVAEVTVDQETGETKLLRLTTAHDTGVILNPIGHQGQIEGGMVQGLGYGLMEEVLVDEGRVATTHFGDYKIPTARDIPVLQTVLLTTEDGVGPYKVKGIGENPVTPVAPAIANAVEDAVGVRVKDLPVTAEKVYQALQERQKRA
jgi:CO/xanthine dehydrogenase Mo-binding subunit